jgi:chromosomal replication initiation ATPase DnaA
VEETTIDFLAARMERSLAAATRIVAALDREGLARGRPVTRALASEVLRAHPEFATSDDYDRSDETH